MSVTYYANRLCQGSGQMILPALAWSGDREYNSRYCHDPAELQKWQSIVNKNPDSDPIAAIHALWIGLCAKVEAHTLTTSRANRIFENFRSALLDQVEQSNEAEQKKEKT